MSEREFHGGKPLDRRYELHTILGTGATATVYKARDIKADKLVAVKVFNPSVDTADIEDEARTQARLHHPNILPFYWYGEHGEYPYIAMMLAKQGSLDDRLAEQGKLPLDEALQVIDEAAEGVQYAHEEGVVHRDLKPRNILLDEDAGKLVRVSDWGIAVKAHSVHSEFTRQEARGTVAYIAPEQLAGKSTKVTDLYSLGGLVAFELVAGERPFKSTDDESYIEARLTQTPATFESVLGNEMTAVHAAIEPVIQQALSRRPTERQGSVGDYAEQLRTEYGKAKATERKKRTHINMPGDQVPGSSSDAFPDDGSAERTERMHHNASESPDASESQKPPKETPEDLDAKIQERLRRLADLGEQERVAEARLGELYLEIAEGTRTGNAAIEELARRLAAVEEQERAASSRLSKLDQEIDKKTKKGNAAAEEIAKRLAAVEEQERAASSRLSKLEQEIDRKTKKDNADIEEAAKRLAALEEQESAARATISELNQEIETKSEQSRSMDNAVKDDQSSGDVTAAEIYTSTGDALLDAERANPQIERAKEILGKDFLGVEAIRSMERKLKKRGVNVKFCIDNLPSFPYTERDLEIAKEEGEMLVLRTDTMRQGRKKSLLTVANFHGLFKNDPFKDEPPVFSVEKRSDGTNWFDKETFAHQTGDIRTEWALISKKDRSGRFNIDKLRAYSEDFQKKGAENINVRNRTPIEIVWDTILCYMHSGRRLLSDHPDNGTDTRSGIGYNVVQVGTFSYEHGLSIHHTSSSYSDWWCTSR